jgi:putative ATP-dependent endonuclease of OLD family
MTKKGQDLKSTPLRNIELSGIHKNYLQRFLDVTKSQLFFAKSVLLVEGISETLLMPSFAARLGEEYNLEKNAVETVNINGVAFEPFANLFNSEVAEKRINVRCAIITDDDRDDDSNISERAQNALNLEKGMVMVFPAKSTLEYELYLENETLMKTIYGKLHPKTNLDFEGDICERAKAFVEKLKANKDKGVFAQTLAGIIEDFEIVKKTYISHEEQCVNIFSQLNDKWTPVQEKNIEKRASIFLDELKKSKHKYKFVYKLSEQIKTTGLLPAIIVPGYIKSALRWAVKGNVTDTN